MSHGKTCPLSGAQDCPVCLRAVLDNIDGLLCNPLALSKDEILNRIAAELAKVGMLAGGPR